MTTYAVPQQQPSGPEGPQPSTPPSITTHAQQLPWPSWLPRPPLITVPMALNEMCLRIYACEQRIDQLFNAIQMEPPPTIVQTGYNGLSMRVRAVERKIDQLSNMVHSRGSEANGVRP